MLLLLSLDCLMPDVMVVRESYTTVSIYYGGRLTIFMYADLNYILPIKNKTRSVIYILGLY